MYFCQQQLSFLFILVTLNIKSIESSTAADEKENRNYLGVFTVVRFSNDACQGKKILRKSYNL